MGTSPVAGTDYPASEPDFDRFFADEAACLDCLVRLRWPSGFVCPAPGCGGSGWLTARGTYACSRCGRHTSPTAGTVFEGTRKPLREWFRVAWRITNSKKGIAALEVASAMGMGHKTAWTWLHKFRRAMVAPDRKPLSGTVEIDETFVGGVEHGAVGQQTSTKAIVVVVVERPGIGRYGRIRLARVPDKTAHTLHAFVLANVAAGSTVITDGHKGYLGLDKKGYSLTQVPVKGSGLTGGELLPDVHLVASHLDRVWLGTHHGAIRRRHLDAYLDEFVFRFNRRTSRKRGLLFYRLMEGAVTAGLLEMTPGALRAAVSRARAKLEVA